MKIWVVTEYILTEEHPTFGEEQNVGYYSSKRKAIKAVYSYLLNELKQRYPDAKIVCLSLMTARTYNNTQFPEKQTEVIQSQATDTTPHYLYEFNASIKEIAARYECIFCDISDVMNYYVSSTLGVHPEAAGHLAIAKRIEALIK